MARHGIFGLAVQTDLRLPGVGSAGPEPPALWPAVTVALAEPGAAEARFSGATSSAGRLVVGDGETIVLTAGRGGDLLLVHSGNASFHVSPERVTCATGEPGRLDWQRALLDTVLVTAALLAGREAIHAAAVVIADGRLVAITAPAGGGKSMLCAELVARGGHLFADDVVALARGPQGAVLACAGPSLMNLPAEAGLERIGGRRLARFGAEQWLSVRAQDADAGRPRRLDRFVVLDRRPMGGPPVLAREPSPMAMLGAALDSGPWPERRAARFALLADLAAVTPAVRLTADVDIPPAALADVIEACP